MNLTGTLVSYYTICKKKRYLSYCKINMEGNSELVKIGKELHEQQKAKYKEVLIDNIKIDKISKQYITEIKKSDADIEASLWQLKYYIYILNKKGLQSLMSQKKSKFKYNYIYLIYDIKEERVNKIFKICKKYLEHYQNSVFRGEISESNILKLKNELNKIINKEKGSVLILCFFTKESVIKEELGIKSGNNKFL